MTADVFSEFVWEFKLDNAFHMAGVSMIFFVLALLVFLKYTEGYEADSRTEFNMWIGCVTSVPLIIVNFCVTRWGQQAMLDVAASNAVMFTLGSLCFLWELLRSFCSCFKKTSASTPLYSVLLFLANIYWAVIFYLIRFVPAEDQASWIEADHLTIMAFVFIGLFLCTAVGSWFCQGPSTDKAETVVLYDNKRKSEPCYGEDGTDNSVDGSDSVDETDIEEQDSNRNGGQDDDSTDDSD